MSAVEVTEIVRSLTGALVLVGLADQSHQRIAVDALAAGARGIVPLPVDAPRLVEEIRDARPTPRGPESSANEVVRGPIALSWSEHRVTAAGAEVRLSPKEFEVLGYLLSRAPRIVSLRDLIDMFEGGDLDRAPRMRVTIAKIRSRLADAAPEVATVVQTVHGIGYRVDPSELREESARGNHPNLPET
jgi:DNA-binding response OmpR family regulator